MKIARGFTLIELLVTLVLVGLVASISVPLYEVTSTRLREAELRSALRQIRAAIDAYKAAADSGLIAKGVTESGYPPSLEILVQGIDVAEPGGRPPPRVPAPGAARSVLPGAGRATGTALGQPQLRQSAGRPPAGRRRVRRRVAL